MGKYLEGRAEDQRAKRLERESYLPDNIGGVSSPEGSDSLIASDAGEAVDDSLVWLREAALLDHLVLVLNQELDALDGG